MPRATATLFVFGLPQAGQLFKYEKMAGYEFRFLDGAEWTMSGRGYRQYNFEDLQARLLFFIPGLPHVILIGLRQALISYQDCRMLLLTRPRCST